MSNLRALPQISKIVYHGTDAIFDRFDETKKGSNTGFPNTIHGFFFTEKKENATLFGERIIKASIVIEKAIDLTIHGIFSEKDQAPLIWKILTDEVLSEEDALTQLDEMIVLAFANATLRELVFVKHLSELLAHQLSTITLIILCSIYTSFVFPLLKIHSSKQAFLIGFVWVLLTVAFEFSLGRMTKKSWQYLFQDYNLFAGRIWPLLIVVLVLLPYLFYASRNK